MSAEKKHDYHLVDPSPWPIYVSFSCLVLAIGTIFYMHNDVSWGMYLGLALVLYGAYMWFRDVVIEQNIKVIIHLLFKFITDME
jgi:cytochrome c oxidase subunit 3